MTTANPRECRRPMIHVTTCPNCSKEVRVPESLWGQVVKCPLCLVQFRADDGREIIASPPEVELAATHAPEQSQPPRLTQCPYCYEAIPPEADDCPVCGKPLNEPPPPPVPRRRRIRRDSEPHRGNTVFLYGLLSLIVAGVGLLLCPFFLCMSFPLGMVAILMANHDLRAMQAGNMDPHGESQTRSGRILGIIGIVLAAVLLVVYLTVIFFVVLFSVFPE